jgi:hypothetical protein
MMARPLRIEYRGAAFHPPSPALPPSPKASPFAKSLPEASVDKAARQDGATNVMAGGNQGQKICANDGGRNMWLARLRKVWRRTGWSIHAWALKGNHYHRLTLVRPAGIDLTAKSAESAKNFGKTDETFPLRGNGVPP